MVAQGWVDDGLLERMQTCTLSTRAQNSISGITRGLT